MDQSYYQYFIERTKDFIFSGENNHSSNLEVRQETIKALLKQVSKMAIRSFYQMPSSFAAVYPKEDWVQFAMIKLLECCDTYDHRRPFDRFVRFTVPRRLTDRQRKIFSENPHTQKGLYSQYKELKRQLGSTPSIEALAEHTGRSENEIKRFLDGGYGKRMFVRQLNDSEKITASRTSKSPEKKYIEKETRQILWDCIDQLTPDAKLLFIRHELEGLSFKRLYEQLPKIKKSLATFKRWYKSDIFDPVKNCVETQFP